MFRVIELSGHWSNVFYMRPYGNIWPITITEGGVILNHWMRRWFCVIWVTECDNELVLSWVTESEDEILLSWVTECEDEFVLSWVTDCKDEFMLFWVTECEDEVVLSESLNVKLRCYLSYWMWRWSCVVLSHWMWRFPKYRPIGVGLFISFTSSIRLGSLFRVFLHNYLILKFVH